MRRRWRWRSTAEAAAHVMATPCTVWATTLGPSVGVNGIVVRQRMQRMHIRTHHCRCTIRPPIGGHNWSCSFRSSVWLHARVLNCLNASCPSSCRSCAIISTWPPIVWPMPGQLRREGREKIITNVNSDHVVFRTVTHRRCNWPGVGSLTTDRPTGDGAREFARLCPSYCVDGRREG